MIKKLLTLTVALLTVGSAFPFEIKRPVNQSTSLEKFSGKVEAKKTLSTRAGEEQNSIDFSLAEEVYTAYKLDGIKKNDEVALAFELSKENATSFADDEIVSINVTTGVKVVGGKYTNSLINITLFITEDLESEPLYTQEATLGENGFTEYKIPLDSPFKIESGKNVFIGYRFLVPNINQYYLPVDYVYHGDDIDGCWVGTKTSTDDNMVWDNMADQVGFICLGCTIRGENFPQDNVRVEDFAGPYYSEPGAEFVYEFLLKNKGLVASNLDLEYKVGNVESSYHFVLEEPIGYNETAIVALPMVCNDVNLSVPLAFNLVKVNGNPNNSKNTKTWSTLDCYPTSSGFPMTHLVEEGTGNWCGWCPRGIVMMEYLAENYPEMFARVAIHGPFSNTVRDPMEVESGLVILQNVLGGSYPSAMIDRTISLDYMDIEEIDEYMAEYSSIPTIMEIIDLNASFVESKKLQVTSAFKSGMDFYNDNRFRLAYYITENHVGPYTQKNYYAGGENGEMGGWESKPESVVNFFYNDVCREEYGGVNGFRDSMPEEIKTNTSYNATAQLEVANVTSHEFYLTAFIVDTSNGRVINSKQIKVLDPSSVKDMDNDFASVSKKYYDINGLEVQNPSKGIYIVHEIDSKGNFKTSKQIIP